ncbi:hypothetical protein MPSEU_000653600 [Mayamaea pseudoterrestris]|nr:hypothetical protein MPSEU_000653600 [Mayamaea pseudoterrestris]
MRCSGLSSCLPFLLAIQKPQDLASSFRSVYEALAVPSSVSYHASPTIRFDKVFNETASDKNNKKPIAVYLPGLDGYGISAATHQFHDMSNTFDFYRLFIDSDDRTSFQQVTNHIVNFVHDLYLNNSQPVTLIGESCGGLFAAACAIQLAERNILKGLVMVNPATSFDRTSWDIIAPQLSMLDDMTGSKSNSTGSRLPSPYSILGSLALAATVPDNEQIRELIRIIFSSLSSPSSSNSSPQDLLETSFDAIRETEARLPSHLLKHRIQWLMIGASVVKSRLNKIDVPTLIMVGKQDKMLPSDSEADQLMDAILNAEKIVVSQRGHLVLDGSINITEAVLYSAIDPLNWRLTKKTHDTIYDWVLPNQEAIDRAFNSRVKPLVMAHSPVWFSTDAQGKRWKGLIKFPAPTRQTFSGVQDERMDEGPILVVGNHQLAGLDLGMILTELWKQCNLWPRGLAHPITFFGSEGRPGELNGRLPGLNHESGIDMRESFQAFGAVLVSPKNYYRLMQSGQDALLFPGGAKEAQSGRTDYPLFWPTKVDFVRTAAKFNATIVPLSAIGMVDSVNILAEPRQIAEIPILGDQLKLLSANISSARFDERNVNETIGFPILVPKLPARNYFLFGLPMNLKGVDPNDKEACAKVYFQVQDQVRQGIDDLLCARELDPYKDAPKRILYEQVFKRPAPTFSVDKLNA